MFKAVWSRPVIATSLLGILTWLLLINKGNWHTAGQVVFYLFAFYAVFIAGSLAGQFGWKYQIDNPAWLRALLVACGPLAAYALWNYHVI